MVVVMGDTAQCTDILKTWNLFIFSPNWCAYGVEGNRAEVKSKTAAAQLPDLPLAQCVLHSPLTLAQCTSKQLVLQLPDLPLAHAQYQCALHSPLTLALCTSKQLVFTSVISSTCTVTCTVVASKKLVLQLPDLPLKPIAAESSD